MAEVMRRVSFKENHQVAYEPLGARARMSDLLERLKPGQFFELHGFARGEREQSWRSGDLLGHAGVGQGAWLILFRLKLLGRFK